MSHRLAGVGAVFSVLGPIMQPRASTWKLRVSISSLSGPVPPSSAPERAQDPCPSHHPLPSEHFLTWALHPTSGRCSKHSQSTVSVSKSFVATPLLQPLQSFPGPLGWSTDSCMELVRSPLLTSEVSSLFLPVPPAPRPW